MTDDETREFALSLAKADAEKEVVRILKESGHWDDEAAWRDYGDTSMNLSTINNQASSADRALVEKLINSVDAVLMRECGRRGVKPDGPGAPKSIAAAQKAFFGIFNGKLSSADASQRRKLAENIALVATGSKSRPSLSIIDKGEGQTPDSIPQTMLSLTKGNKIKIPFVQGKFGMGGSGALRFCSSEHNLQLLISRRDPKIESADPTKALWGVTVIRKEDPKEDMRSSYYTYLAPKGKVLRFAAPALPLLPNPYPEALGAPLESGAYVKLYEYEIGRRLSSLILFDLYNRLALLMPDVALPIRMMERRKDYDKTHSYETTLAGLSVRLDEDRNENLEPEFRKPGTGGMVVDGQKFDYAISVFKKGKKENYARSEGVVFSLNGQAHGFLRKAFFERKAVGMSYLSDSILVIVDCSEISRKMEEKLLMPSRDRLARTPFLDKIESELESILKNHPGLKDLRNRRREEELQGKLQDSKPLTEVLTNIIEKDPTLSRLFQSGTKLPDPFKRKDVGKTEKFQGREFPTHFRLARPAKNYTEETPKRCPRNRKCQVQFETDAENDYFERDRDPGEFTLKSNGEEIRDYSLNLWNGLATLQINLPPGAAIGDLRCFKTEVDDISRPEPFSSAFWIRIEEEGRTNGSSGRRKKPPGETEGKDRERTSHLALPQVREIRRDRWEDYKFDRDSALKVRDAGEESGYDFFVNMDNVHLQTEMKADRRTEPQILEERYKTGMVLLGMSLLHADEKNGAGKHNGSEPTEDGSSVYDRISEFTEAASPVLLPMIASLGSLEAES